MKRFPQIKGNYNKKRFRIINKSKRVSQQVVIQGNKMQEKNVMGQVSISNGNREELSSTDRSNQQYNYQFYDEYKKLFDTTINLSAQLKLLIQRKQEAWEKLSKLQKRAEEFRDDIRGEPPQRKKRSRRTADEIQREFRCQAERCSKSYGTEGSLYQHIKLKHTEMYEEMKKKQKINSISDSGVDESERGSE